MPSGSPPYYAANGCNYGQTLPYNFCYVGTGRPIIDLTKGSLANTLANLPTSGGLGGLYAVTVGTAVPVSNAWGQLVTNLSPNATDVTGPPFFTTMTFQVNNVTGTFDTTHLICFSSIGQDYTIPTSVSGTGTITITAPVHKPHQGGEYIFQGGMCGYGVVQTAQQQGFAANQGANKYVQFVVGSNNSTTLQVQTWATNNTGLQLLSLGYQTANVTSMSSTGTTVTVSGVSWGGNTWNPPGYEGGTVVFSGSSNAAYNGVPCRNQTWSDQTDFTCTIAGLTGTQSGGAATYQQANSAGVVYATLELWPIAYPLDVQNETLSPPLVDGTITLMPSAVPFANGDTIVEMNHPALTLEGGKFNVQGQNPWTNVHSIYTGIGGLASTGGSYFAASNSDLFISNNPGNSNLIDFGGVYEPVNTIDMAGPYYNFLTTNYGPASGGTMIYANPTAQQNSNPNYKYNMFNGSNRQPYTYTALTVTPYTGEADYLTNGPATYTASEHDFSGPVNMSSATLSTTAGLVSGNALNYAPYSNFISAGSTWAGLSGGTEVCTLFDDFGNPACSLAQTGTSGWNLTNVAGGSYTPLTLNSPYTIQARMKGALGGEQVTMSMDAMGENPIGLSTTWTDYCLRITPNRAPYVTWVAQLNVSASSATIYVSNVVVRPGTACGPPILTTNNQFLTASSVNHVPGYSASIASGTAVMTTAAIASGTCGATATGTATNGVLANITTTDSIKWAYNAVVTIGTGLLIVNPWVTAGGVNFNYCNPTAASITPTAATINWSVTR